MSIDVAAGETLGLVGESGSGKTTLGRAILVLVSPASGSILFDDENTTGATARVRRRLVHSIQVVFQDPYTSLNPAMSIEGILSEPLIAQGQKAKDAGGTGERSARSPRDASGLGATVRASSPAASRSTSRSPVPSRWSRA